VGGKERTYLVGGPFVARVGVHQDQSSHRSEVYPTG
jgi:hypothetical protein